MIGTVAVFFGGGGWWLSSQLRSLEQSLAEKISTAKGHLLTKLDEHEQHDDLRFQQQSTIASDYALRIQRLEILQGGITRVP